MSKNFENWSDYKGALLEGLDEKRSRMMDVLFENVHRENVKTKDQFNTVIVESNTAGSTVTSNISRYDMLFMPLIRRTMPSLVAMELVGNQPLNGPRGIVRTMRKRYSKETEDNDTNQSVVVAAGTEASGQEVFEKYSKLQFDGYYEDVDAMNPFEQTVYLEGDRGKPMDLEVVTDSVETMSRKLSATYSLESADDLQALDGLDMESEVNDMLSDEIIRELDREVIDFLNDQPVQVETVDFAEADGRYAGERLAAMSLNIDKLSGDIAKRILKGGATWMLTSMGGMTALKNASNVNFTPVNTFTPANQGQPELRSSLYAGQLGTIAVYIDPYTETDYFLLGYKGNDIDAPVFYLPYIPLSSSGLQVLPESGDHRVMMRTRYALKAFDDSEVSLGDSADHFARGNLVNLEFGFKSPT